MGTELENVHVECTPSRRSLRERAIEIYMRRMVLIHTLAAGRVRLYTQSHPGRRAEQPPIATSTTPSVGFVVGEHLDRSGSANVVSTLDFKLWSVRRTAVATPSKPGTTGYVDHAAGLVASTVGCGNDRFEEPPPSPESLAWRV